MTQVRSDAQGMWHAASRFRAKADRVTPHTLPNRLNILEGV